MKKQLSNYKFTSVGRDVTIFPLAKIVASEVISIGNSVIIDDFVFIMGGEGIKIGSFVHIGCFTSIVGGGKLVMDDFSGLSGGVRLYTGNEDYLGGCLTNPTVPEPYRKTIRSYIKILKHAIVGANTVILPGVTIGEGAAVGANSLVREDCLPWTIYAGNPAKALSQRSSEKILEMEKRLRSELFDKYGNYRCRVE